VIYICAGNSEKAEDLKRAISDWATGMPSDSIQTTCSADHRDEVADTLGADIREGAQPEGTIKRCLKSSSAAPEGVDVSGVVGEDVVRDRKAVAGYHQPCEHLNTTQIVRKASLGDPAPPLTMNQGGFQTALGSPPGRTNRGPRWTEPTLR